MGVEILYKPKGKEWLTPRQFRAAALAYGIITGLISGALILDSYPNQAQPTHINTANEPVKK